MGRVILPTCPPSDMVNGVLAGWENISDALLGSMRLRRWILNNTQHAIYTMGSDSYHKRLVFTSSEDMTLFKMTFPDASNPNNVIYDEGVVGY